MGTRDDTLDEALYSRQLYVLGHAAQLLKVVLFVVRQRHAEAVESRRDGSELRLDRCELRLDCVGELWATVVRPNPWDPPCATDRCRDSAADFVHGQVDHEH